MSLDDRARLFGDPTDRLVAEAVWLYRREQGMFPIWEEAARPVRYPRRDRHHGCGHVLLFLMLLLETAPDDEPDEEKDDAPADADDDHDDDADQDDDVHDPEKHALSQEAMRWRRKFRKAEERLQELETDGRAAIALHRENAFLRAVLASSEPIAVEDAWDLLNAKGFADLMKVSDEGEVSGVDEAMEKLLDRYPWLIDPDAEERSEPATPPPSGGKAKKKDAAKSAPREAQLKDRFSALRGRR